MEQGKATLVGGDNAMEKTRGVVQIHSAPSALCPHIEWAIGGIFGVPAELRWAPQPAERGSYRAEFPWHASVGSAARVASAMKRWERVRFEVTEDATAVSEGVRYSYTPALGIFQATVSHNGDILVHEDRVRLALLRHRDAAELRKELDELIGAPWDAELDVFRAADEGAPVRWLNRVG